LDNTSFVFPAHIFVHPRQQQSFLFASFFDAFFFFNLPGTVFVAKTYLCSRSQSPRPGSSSWQPVFSFSTTT
jgi:hypothetical protein